MKSNEKDPMDRWDREQTKINKSFNSTEDSTTQENKLNKEARRLKRKLNKLKRQQRKKNR